MAAPILNLDSLVDRQTVRIDAQEYELLTVDLLPPLDAHRLSRCANRIGVLMAQADLTEAEEAELDDLPKRMCRLLLVAPDEVQQRLTQRHRMAIVATFLTPPQPTRPLGSDALPAPPSTGVNGSPASSGSTAATP